MDILRIVVCTLAYILWMRRR